MPLCECCGKEGADLRCGRCDHAGAAASFAKAVQLDPTFTFPNAQQFLTQALEAVRKSRS